MKIKRTPIFYSFLFILTMNSMYAQDEIEIFLIDTQDTVTATPINNYLSPMLLLGVAIGFRLIIKFQKKNSPTSI
jgi:hypothetical protein